MTYLTQSRWTPILLLIVSNVFMTFAWYGHLRFKEKPLPLVILASWGIAFFEYMLMVPANRWGLWALHRRRVEDHSGGNHADGVQRICSGVSRRKNSLESSRGVRVHSGRGDVHVPAAKFIRKAPVGQTFQFEFRAYTAAAMSFYDKLKFNSDGLIPAIVQEQSTGRVLMMAWMNRASIEKTLATGKTHFWSRSRQKVLDEGRDQRPHANREGLSVRLRWRHAAHSSRTNRRGLPRGLQVLLFSFGRSNGRDFKASEPQLETPEEIYGKK
jgi:hypothetical protein